MWIDFQQRFTVRLPRVLSIQPTNYSSKHIQHRNRRWLLFLLLSFTFTLNVANANFRPKVEVISGKGNNIVSFSGRDKVLENSPIYYLKVGSNKNLPLSSSSSPLSLLSSPSSYSPVKRRVNSNLYKLPLTFVSNAKPVEIIQGIAGKKMKPFSAYHNKVKVHPSKLGSTVYKHHHNSKVFYLPTKFVSNGKPVKPILFSKINNNNREGKRKFYYYHYQTGSKRLKYGEKY